MKKPEPYWITARQFHRLTGLDKFQASKIRKINPMSSGIWKLSDTGGYLWNANKIPELLKANSIHSL